MALRISENSGREHSKIGHIFVELTGFVVKVVFELFQKPGKADDKRDAVRLGKECWEIIEASAVAVFVHKTPPYSAELSRKVWKLIITDFLLP